MEAAIAEGKPGTHGGECVVQEQGVRHPGTVVTCKPDLVHPIVETDDTVLRHDLANVVHDALRCQGKTTLAAAIGQMGENLLA